MSIKSDINSLQKLDREAPGLGAAKTPAPIRQKTGLSEKTGAGGIASPLTETQYSDRVYYATFTLTSSDGLFVMELKRIARMKFTDAADRPVEIAFADKP